MSDDSIPAPNGQHKPVGFLSEDARIEILMRLSAANALSTDTLNLLRPPCDADRMARTPVPTLAKPRRRRPPQPRRPRPRTSTVTPYQAKRAAMEDLPLTRLRRYGFTPYFGEDKQFLMLPPEFELVLACESRQVVQVIHEVMKQSVGYAGEGEHGRREWVVLSLRHFEHRGLMGRDAAKLALYEAVEKGYLLRRPHGRQQWKYAVHYRQGDNVPH